MTWTSTAEDHTAPEQCTCNHAPYFDHMFHWWLEKNQALFSLCCKNAAYVWGSYTTRTSKAALSVGLHELLTSPFQTSCRHTPRLLANRWSASGHSWPAENTGGKKPACINKKASETQWVVTLKPHNPVHNHTVIRSSCESCDKPEESQTKGPRDLWRDFI